MDNVYPGLHNGADIVPVSTSGRVSPSGKVNASSGDNNAHSIAFGSFSLRGHSSKRGARSYTIVMRGVGGAGL